MESRVHTDTTLIKGSARANESNMPSQTNGEYGKSLFFESPDCEEDNYEVQREIDRDGLLKQSSFAKEFSEKLHICNSTVNTMNTLLNGCNPILHDQMSTFDSRDESYKQTTKDHNTTTSQKHTSSESSIQCLKTENSIHQRTLKESSATEVKDNYIDINSHNCSNSSTVRSTNSTTIDKSETSNDTPIITYVSYESEKQMPDIMRLIQKDLSEPYSIYTYRYFIHNWPKLCFLAMDGNLCVGAIVCKLDVHKKQSRRGYIAMLAVDEKYRKRKIGSRLVLKAITAMIDDQADEVVLETEITNKPALKLYENLGFVRDKRLFRYYLNGVDALRLKLWLK